MNKAITLVVVLAMVLFCSGGCGKSPDKESKDLDSAMENMYSPQQDKNVTSDPHYNSSAFAGTLCRTKVKVAIAESKRYTGLAQTKLLVPQRFDSAHPHYIPSDHMRIISILPVGTVLRIEKLMEDQGAWGGIQVEAVLVDGTNANKAVFLDGFFLVGNRWSRGPTSNNRWDINPEMLEEVK